MSLISPLASVHPKARIGRDVEIGPFSVIGEHVEIGDGSRIYNNVTVIGHTRIGSGNVIFPNAVIGTPPQDLKYRGGPTRVEIGDNNQIRESVTIQAGTETGSGITRLGSNNLLMVNTHIGHDANFGSKCILGNNVMIAGHVECHDGVAMMGGVGIHHFVTVGEYAYIAGYARVHHDVPPFIKLDGADRVRALNALGLKRNGFTDADIDALEAATRRLFFGREKPFSVTLAELAATDGVNTHVKRMLDFLQRRNQGKHGRYLEAHRSK
jgi:UDP-N-acetylglucosamine acyltransferase